MKKKWSLLLIVVLVLTSMLAACGGSKSGNGNKDASASPSAASSSSQSASTEAASSAASPAEDMEGTLEFWTFDTEDCQRYADAFMALHPNVKINVTNPGWNELPANLQNAIAAGSGAPDLAMVPGGLWKFDEGLEDLLQEPYDAGQYQADFSEADWTHWLSLDGKKLIGMPWDYTPIVTFYRPDLLEKAGYPSDPNELVQFMQDPDKVIEMGQALKAQGVYLFEFNQTPLDMVTMSTSFFDRKLNYARNTDEFAQFMDLSKKIKQLGLAMNKSAAWSDDGKALTSTGKVAMLFYGPWYNGQLQGMGDDQAGKWKITGLPFGKVIGGAGSTMVIPSQGKNKLLAWKFIEFALATKEGNKVWVSHGGIPGFIPAFELDSFKNGTYKVTGDQKVNELFANLIPQIKDNFFDIPVNDAAGKIWGDSIQKAIEKNTDSKAALQQIQDDILKAVKPDLDKLKAKMGI